MKLLFARICFTLLNACGVRPTETVVDSGQTNSNIQLTASVGDVDQPTDPVAISAVRIKGNTMLIDISYSGGCTAHEFEVIGSSMIAKSLPPIRHIQLVHKSNGDQCKSIINTTLKVDIKALAYVQTAGSEIILTMDGWKDRINYVFE